MNRPEQSALFDGETPEPRRNDRPEAAALVEVLQALRTHSAVAWCERMNSGAAKMGNRFIRFGFRGCPDVLGMLKDGRLLACEVKAPKGRLRPEQAAFLELVGAAGGLAFVARNCRDVFAALDIGHPTRNPRTQQRCPTEATGASLNQQEKCNDREKESTTPGMETGSERQPIWQEAG